MKQRWRSTTVVAIGLMGGLFAWAQYAAALQTLPDKERPPADGKYLSQKLKHDGMDRSYRIYVPTSYREKQAVPLVVVLHGTTKQTRAMYRRQPGIMNAAWVPGTAAARGRFGGNSRNPLLRRAFHIPGGELIIAYGNWDRMAEARGFLVAAPDSRGHAFSDGSGRGGADVKSIDDSAFIDSVIDDMKRRYAIDARRIYLVGLSSGGSMAQTMAIERPGKIAAFAAVMGHLWPNDRPPAPTRPMLLLFGDSDKLNPMNGGAVKYHPIIGVTLDKPGPNQTAELWSKRMGCGDSSMPDEGPAVDVTFWPSCRDGSELMLFIVRNLAHHWPGGAKPSDKAIKAIGPYTDAVDATELIWDFFSQHRRR